MTPFYDAVVIGGGFAGVTAARELTNAGHRVVLLEGRDRLGGRTWYKEEVLPGRNLELGGTWVHWLQPHVFAEITRYGMELAESHAAIEPERFLYLTGGERRDVRYADVWPTIEAALEAFFAVAREALPLPYQPLSNEAIATLDAQSVQDRIDALDVTGEQRDILSAILSLCCSAKCRDGGLVTLLKWYALPGWGIDQMFDAVVRYKLKAGTRALIEAMAADSTAEIRFDAPVASVAQDDDAVTVTTRDGEQFRGATAIVTVPLNTLSAIEFTPALSEVKAEAAAAGQASRGLKVWVRVRGDLPETLAAIAPDDHALNWMHTEYLLDDGQILVGFGNDGAALDVENLEQVAPAVRELLGDVDVVETAGHNWLSDEFALGTWPVLRPNQLTGSLAGLQAPEGRVLFGGSETANGWNGFIDGAIESGLRTSREAQQVLGPARSAAEATA
jgi:pseudooxynicotine oxidase